MRLESLREALTEQDVGNRLEAAFALAQHGIFEGKDVFLNALSDRQEWARLKAAEMLHQIGPSWAISQLGNLLNDEESYIRNQAIWALVGVGRPAVVPFLIQALQDPDEERREDGRAALVLLLGKEVPVVSGLEGETEEEFTRVYHWWRDRQAYYDEARCYYRGNPISLGQWIRMLDTSPQPTREWITDSLKWWTGLELGSASDPKLALVWEEWWSENSHLYEVGRRYFYGHVVE